MEYYRSRSCAVCGTWNRVSGHHIKSRGAHGPDVTENLVALCFICHTAVHKMGVEKFIEKHPIYKTILLNKGFEHVQINEKEFKWINFELERLCNGVNPGDDQASALQSAEDNG